MTAPTSISTLLNAPFDDLTARSPYVGLTTHVEGAGWQSASQLLGDPPSIDHYLTMVAAATRTTDRKIAVSFFLQGYLWGVAGGIAGAYLRAGRVPLAPLEGVWMRFDPSGNPAMVAFTTPEVALLPDDPAASHPNAVVVADAAALQTTFRTILQSHCAALITALRPHTTLPAQSLWRLATDRCAGVIIFLCQLLGVPERAEAIVTALVSSPTSSFTPTTGVACYTLQGVPQWILRRSGCCLVYKLPGSPYCTTCPLLSEAERVARLSATPSY